MRRILNLTLVIAATCLGLVATASLARAEAPAHGTETAQAASTYAVHVKGMS